MWEGEGGECVEGRVKELREGVCVWEGEGVYVCIWEGGSVYLCEWKEGGVYICVSGFSLKRGAAAVRRATAKVRTLNLKHRSERCAALQLK